MRCHWLRLASARDKTVYFIRKDFPPLWAYRIWLVFQLSITMCCSGLSVYYVELMMFSSLRSLWWLSKQVYCPFWVREFPFPSPLLLHWVSYPMQRNLHLSAQHRKQALGCQAHWQSHLAHHAGRVLVGKHCFSLPNVNDWSYSVAVSDLILVGHCYFFSAHYWLYALKLICCWYDSNPWHFLVLT